jgi:auxin responsive GH3 family protein
MVQTMPNLDKGKGMYFLFRKSENETLGALLASPVSTTIYKSSYFNKMLKHDPYRNYTSPIDTTLYLDSYQSMYSQLLCGLCQNEQVLHVGAVFAYTFICFVKFFEKYWVRLCNDIRTGTLDSEITNTPMRAAVMNILKLKPALAFFIEEDCKKESWEGIITTLWTNTKYVDANVSGTMSQYIPLLDYYTNGLPIVCTMYASSECHFGLNLNILFEPSQVRYTL